MKFNRIGKIIICVLLSCCLTAVLGCSQVSEVQAAGRVNLAKAAVSPKWIGNLKAARNAKQVFVVAGVGQTTAYISMHEKDSDGTWNEFMTTPGFIGRSGLDKQREGDGKTPTGVFRFNRAFGIAKDPGCRIKYKKVTGADYWSGDSRPGHGYNTLVSIKDIPDLNTGNSERIIDYVTEYQYCLNLGYNADCVAGKGAALFLHSFGSSKPYTAGCVAIPQDQMLKVMQNVRPDCVVIIDHLAKLSPETKRAWGY